MTIKSKNEHRSAMPRARKYELFFARPVRETANGWLLLVDEIEYVIESRHFTYRDFSGKHGTRWVIKIQKWLVLQLGLLGGVPIREVPEMSRDSANAAQLALPLGAPQ